jgi:hypothetical protein
VRYVYDEWSNVRRVQASYTHSGQDGPWASDGWYVYDTAGRMTISNGAMSDGTIRLKFGSAQIGYDGVGRRSATTEYVRKNTTSNPTFVRTWDTMRDERYEYDDLGHLRKIEQRVRHVKIKIVTSDENGSHPGSEPDRVGSWQMLSSRFSNLRGDVTHAEQWSRVSGLPNNLSVDEVPAHIGTTTSVYRADDQVAWTETVADDPTRSTMTQYVYYAETGQLSSYEFSAYRSDLTPYIARFTYSHTFQNGNRVVSRISDAHNGLDTTKTYDPLGRLSYERVDLQRPNGSGSDRYEERLFEYGAQGRIIFKDTQLGLSASGPDTVPLPTPTTGRQTYVYAGDRIVATVGAERLEGSTNFHFAYTPMSEAATFGTSRYVVQSGDTLIDIAQAIYGDGALWYVIADANSISDAPEDPLPASEVGKAYEIPGVIRSTNGANTFTPYDSAEIIGNDRPIAIPPPPPPRISDIELMAVAAVSITLQVGVTVGFGARHSGQSGGSDNAS